MMAFNKVKKPGEEPTNRIFPINLRNYIPTTEQNKPELEVNDKIQEVAPEIRNKSLKEETLQPVESTEEKVVILKPNKAKEEIGSSFVKSLDSIPFSKIIGVKQREVVHTLVHLLSQVILSQLLK